MVIALSGMSTSCLYCKVELDSTSPKKCEICLLFKFCSEKCEEKGLAEHKRNCYKDHALIAIEAIYTAHIGLVYFQDLSFKELRKNYEAALNEKIKQYANEGSQIKKSSLKRDIIEIHMKTMSYAKKYDDYALNCDLPKINLKQDVEKSFEKMCWKRNISILPEKKYN